LDLGQFIYIDVSQSAWIDRIAMIFGLPGFWRAVCFTPMARRALNFTEETVAESAGPKPARFGPSVEVGVHQTN
jgi:hypothetical protein